MPRFTFEYGHGGRHAQPGVVQLYGAMPSMGGTVEVVELGTELSLEGSMPSMQGQASLNATLYPLSMGGDIPPMGGSLGLTKEAPALALFGDMPPMGGQLGLTLPAHSLSFAGNMPAMAGAVGLNKPQLMSLAGLIPVMAGSAGLSQTKRLNLASNIPAMAGSATLVSSRPYNQEVMADAPLGYWRLLESSGTLATDSSGNNLHGTYEGQWSSSPGLVRDGGGITLTGSANFNGVRISYSQLTEVRSTYTIEAWFISNGNPDSSAIYEEGGAGLGFSLYCKSNVVYAMFVQNSTPTFLSSAVTSGSRYHAVMTFDNGALKFYLNGILVASGTFPTTVVPVHGDAAGIGTSNSAWRTHDGITGNVFTFNGRIGEVAVYPQALSAARIGAHYGAGV